jgi:ketosteroid isomerase-like protein
MLGQYAAAFGRKDVATISRLHPSIGEAALKSIRSSRSFIVTITEIRVSVAAGGATATVTARVRIQNRPEAGETLDTTESTQFQLEKRGQDWVILVRRKI